MQGSGGCALCPVWVHHQTTHQNPASPESGGSIIELAVFDGESSVVSPIVCEVKESTMVFPNMSYPWYSHDHMHHSWT